MSAQQLAEEIESLIVSTSEEFGAEVEAFQGILYNRVLGVLKDLELDADGYIKQSAANRRILYDAENVIYELLPNESFTGIVTQALTAIPALETLNSDYFSGMSDSFNPSRTFVKSLQNQTIKSVESNLLNEGLIVSVKNPLIDILNQNINSGGSFAGCLQQVRNFIEGDENEGRLLSYSRGFLRDTLFNYSRSYQQAMTADLKLTWYMYAGGVIDHTRPFCAERAGNFYNDEEIKGWASLNWQGKNPNTTESSIFTYCGGYNCAHSLVPVDKSIIPKEDLARAAKANN